MSTPPQRFAVPLAATPPPRVRRIRVMLAIDGLGLGGAEMVVADLARHLNRDRFEVSVCCTRGLGGSVGEGLLKDGFDVFVLEGQDAAKVDYLKALKFRRALTSRGIDVVHTHALPALLDAGPCRMTLPRLRAVHTFHYGNYPYDEWHYHLLEGLAARAMDRLVAVGLEQRRRIQQVYRLRESKVSVLWNGVSIGPPNPESRFRERVGAGDRLLVGTIAKLIEQKGLDDLLHVARRCRDQGLPLHFAIVGEGPLRLALERQRRDLGLDDTVAIPGWVPNAASEALPAFDIFFQPSRWEAMSIAILEAMAGGKAIVATKVGDNPHVIEDGISGLLVESGDVVDMARALSTLTQPEYRQRLAKAARARFSLKFTLDHMIQGYEAIYLALASA